MNGTQLPKNKHKEENRMRRMLSKGKMVGILAALLVLFVIVGYADGGATDELEDVVIVEALTIERLATRSGPSTAYRETGTYDVKGEHVRVISLAYDHNDVCWVQCEVTYRNKLRRVYTGLKRFDADSFDVEGMPVEEIPEDKVKVTATSKAMYGPGEGYDTYESLTVDKGQSVIVIAVENDYAQVEWTTSIQSYRA